MSSKMQGSWTKDQIRYINFLARGKKTKRGVRQTEQNFADAIGVDFSTVWRWKQIPGFKFAVLEAKIGDNLGDLSEMFDSHIANAKGVEAYYTTVDPKTKKEVRKKLKPDVQSFREILKVWGLMIDRSEVDNTGDITHKWEEVPDDELDRAIKARQDRAA